MALTDNLVVYYKLDEASGSRADAVGTSTLTDHGTTGQGTGILGSCATFNGSTQYLTVTDNADVSVGDVDWTCQCWVKFTSVAGYQRFFSKDNGAASREWMVGYEAGSNNKFVLIVWGSASGGGFKQINGSTFGTPTTGVWYHVMCWHDATANTAYLSVNNGTADTVAITTGIYDGAADLYVGAQQGPSQMTAGSLDDMAIWKRVLTSGERTSLYNSGNGLAYPFSTSSYAHAMTLGVGS